MGNKTLTHDELVVLVQKRRNGGRTLQQVADEFAISVSSVRRMLGVVPAPKAAPQKRGGAAVKTATSNGHRKGSTVANGHKSTSTPKVKVLNATSEVAWVKTAELHRWLSDVQPFRGTDDTLPMLTGTHVESDGKRLLAATTDRFTMGVSKLDIPKADDSGGGATVVLDSVDFMLSSTDVATLLKIAKTAKRDADWRAVTISQISEVPTGCTVPTVKYRFAFGTGETIIVTPFDVEFPKFKQLIPKTGNEVARAATGFTVDYLARFAKVANERNNLMRMFTHDNTPRGAKPISVLIGDNFVGLIMPQGLGDELQSWERPKWL